MGCRSHDSVIFLYCCGCLARAFSLSTELFLATGNVDTQARLEVKRAVLSTSLFVIGALISLEAAAATRIVDAIIAISFYWPHVKKMTGMTSKDFRSTYRTGALLTLLALLPSAAVRIFLSGISGESGRVNLCYNRGDTTLGCGPLLVIPPSLRNHPYVIAKVSSCSMMMDLRLFMG